LALALSEEDYSDFAKLCDMRITCSDRKGANIGALARSTTTSSLLSNRALAGLATVIVFAAICFRLGHLPLMAPDEGWNAEVSR